MPEFPAQRRPCAECPWRTDVEPGRFPPERYRLLAGTAYDLSERVFACHKSLDDAPLTCAGFLERGAAHNLAVRFAYILRRLEVIDRSGGLPLHPDYRSMAIANGVDPDDLVLRACRSNSE